MAKLDSLDLPDGIHEEQEGHELVRFWISSGVDHVSLNIGLFDNDKEPSVWGTVAADIAKHAVRAMLQDDPTRDEATLYAEIERAFSKRLKAKANFEGQLRGEKH
ncbi:DUF5076 domain-containing protein [Hyphococcus sp.]|uniref:DUF5076 domain-containing protein n=1 Tax=Hyphococcus sp. TaxID=2038636 RepID=UPI003CCC2ED4